MFFKSKTNPKVLISLDLQNLVLGLEDSKLIVKVQIKFDCMRTASLNGWSQIKGWIDLVKITCKTFAIICAMSIKLAVSGG